MKRHLLIIEDDNDTFRAYITLLEDKFHIKQCTRVAEIPRLLQFRPDAIMLDLKLPDGNGSDMIPMIRRHCPDAKLLIVTGYVEKLGEREDSLDEHNVVLLPKPFYWDDLERELADLPRGVPADGSVSQPGGEFSSDSGEEADN